MTFPFLPTALWPACIVARLHGDHSLSAGQHVFSQGVSVELHSRLARRLLGLRARWQLPFL